MTAPKTPQGPSSPDEDPTGVRQLLASLPDPGPMPQDVTLRIESALREEQAARGSSSSDNVTPLVSRSTGDDTDVERVDTRTSSGNGGSVRWLRPLAAVGAAAAIGIGALAGYQALRGDQGVAPAAAPPSSSAAQQQPSGSDVLDRITIQNSGREYSASGLATQAAALKTPTSTMDPAQASAQGTGPIGTPAGLLSCMRSMGTEMLGGGLPDKISADLGKYEGQPAVIVVVTEGGESKAWVLSRTCTDGNGKIAGPTAVV